MPGKDKKFFDDSALLPIDLISGDHHPPAFETGYWRARTSSIRRVFSCTELDYILKESRTLPDHFKGINDQRLKVNLPDNFKILGGEKSISLDPCNFMHNASQNGIDLNFAAGTEVAICAKWRLEAATSGTAEQSLPTWLIGISYSNLTNWNPSYGLFFDATEMKFLALTCMPKIFTGEGNVTLVSNEDGTQKLEDAYI
ncbi:hypothetical protein G7Y89_g3363 [Cudoniella acicularis]|uniref:Uncharacterized protein n=1 Tax=Cudoniella acicularis TaxID=354080 RepID=A0A8H4RTG9_9HELO|nr:hypothetical protein G7Y89_g3363 [Cudoniella acicularis]